MLRQVTEIEVEKPANEIYSFLLNLDKEKYCNWHPFHKDFKTIKRTNNTDGSVFYLYEVVDGTKADFNWTVIEHKENKMVKMKANLCYPLYLTLEFDKISPSKTIVRQKISVGFDNKLGKILDFFVSKIAFTKKVRKSQREHAIEEYKNLEKIL